MNARTDVLRLSPFARRAAANKATGVRTVEEISEGGVRQRAGRCPVCGFDPETGGRHDPRCSYRQAELRWEEEDRL